MSTRTHISFPAETIRRIDEVRGDVPRSRWILRAVERFFEDRPAVPLSEPVLREAISEGLGRLDAVSPEPSAGKGKTSRPMVPVPGVVRASSLAKVGVKPIPKRGEK